METDSPRSGKEKKKSTSWQWIIIAFVLLSIIGVSIAYFDNKISNTNSSTSSSASSKKPFLAIPNADEPLLVTINTRAHGGSSGSTTSLQSDGKGNYNYTLYVNGKPYNTSIYTPDALYTCKDNSTPCVKYPRDISNTNSNPSGLLYTPAKIKILKEATTYQGQQRCPVGTGICDVWLYGPNKNIDMKLFYVNTANKNIVMVLDTGHFGTSEIVTRIEYDYKEVSIAVPANYTNAPAGSQ